MGRSMDEMIAERLREMTLFEDLLMCRAFKGCLPLAEYALRLMIGRQDLDVLSVMNDRSLRGARKHMHCLDAQASLGGVACGIEVWCCGADAEPKRARYHSGLADANFWVNSGGFSELPATYVVMIARGDPFGMGLPVYEVTRVVKQTGRQFGDGSSIIYVNGALVTDTPLGRLMHDFGCADAGDMHYKILADRVRWLKETPEGLGEIKDAIRERIIDEMEAGGGAASDGRDRL